MTEDPFRIIGIVGDVEETEIKRQPIGESVVHELLARMILDLAPSVKADERTAIVNEVLETWAPWFGVDMALAFINDMQDTLTQRPISILDIINMRLAVNAVAPPKAREIDAAIAARQEEANG